MDLEAGLDLRPIARQGLCRECRGRRPLGRASSASIRREPRGGLAWERRTAQGTPRVPRELDLAMPAYPVPWPPSRTSLVVGRAPKALHQSLHRAPAGDEAPPGGPAPGAFDPERGRAPAGPVAPSPAAIEDSVEQAAFAWGHGAVENEPFPKRCRYPAMPASRTSSCVTPCHPTDRDYSGRASHSWDLGAAAPIRIPGRDSELCASRHGEAHHG